MNFRVAKTRDPLFIEGVGERCLFGHEYGIALHPGGVVVLIHRETMQVTTTPWENVIWAHPKLAPAVSLDPPPATAQEEERAAEAPPAVTRGRKRATS